ncbi:MAG: hypothetical protein WDM92_13970 [Caulobacteraceae bacterium]
MITDTAMRPACSAYPLPDRLTPVLARVLAYWEGLKRGSADIPFWDDVRLTDLPDINTNLAVVDVFAAPERFRYSIVGEALTDGQPGDVAGRFLDETELAAPLDYMRAQCAAAVESAAPTYVAGKGGGARGYGRLVLPLWGEGQIRMLLAAVERL